MLICCTAQQGPSALEWAQVIGAFAAVGGLLWAAFTYDRNSKQRRAEWLGTLFEMFYMKNNYKRVRRLMDDGTLAKVATSGNPVAQAELEEAVVDYLNFFEFIGSLNKMGQLTKEEIEMMFDYYLRLMKKEGNIEYLEREHLKYGFEQVSRMLGEIKE